MSRIFAYGRVSTNDQTTSQQLMVIQNAGYDVIESRFVTDENISGSVVAMQRPAFSNLVNNKLESGDTLVISKLDRLGRDNIDLQTTIKSLTNKGIKVIVLDLPCPDLSSSQGKLMLQMFAAFAEFEKNRISERTKEALAKKKLDGVILGRPKADTSKIQVLKANGMSQSQVSKELSISISTVKRNWK
ncbi:recombinase family protein [Photobacterium phosphoreum]|uniref:recombinase family protein n=1 Tax=Photobacterium phosphoreum TaxID=659 RepID=UPI001E594AE8|nr:recombinase family protein [Photobacterium phosphoreum]MCD9504866.1 recombinase family protein [Photobacterium phosphoreum]